MFLMHFRQRSTGGFKNSPLRRGRYPQPRLSWSQLILRKSMKLNLNRKHIIENLGCVYSTMSLLHPIYIMVYTSKKMKGVHEKRIYFLDFDELFSSLE